MSWMVRSGALALALATLGAAAPAAAVDPSVRFRLGIFTPEADSDYWDEKFFDFTGDPDDFEDVVFGGDLLYPIHPRLSFMLSVDHTEGSVDQAYRDFVDAEGFDILHTTTLSMTPLTVGLVLHLAPPRSPVAPYIGAGGGLYFWELTESGDFIDFGVQPAEVFTGTFEDTGQALGYYLVGGLEVPLGAYWSFLAEARWDRADDELEEDFAGLGTLDLSGRRIMGGFAWRF